MITTESKKLLKAVSKAATVVEPTAVLPVIQNLLFHENGGKLNIAATNLSATINVLTDINIEAGFSTAVSTKTLVDLLKAVSGDITLTFEGNTLVLAASTGEYQIATIPGIDFPAIDIHTGPNTIKAYLLERAVDLTSKTVSNDDLRPTMGGIFFDFDNGKIVSTDGHRMSVYTLPENIEGENCIVPPKALSLIKGLSDADINYGIKDNHISFTAPEFSFKIRLVEGNYPPYQKVIPQGNDSELLVDNKDLLNSVKRVSLFTNSDTKTVAFDLVGGIQITGQDINFNASAEEKLEGVYNGTPLKIGFNAGYLSELLSITGDGSIKMTFSEASKPALIYNSNNPKLLQLVMPVML